MVTVRRVRVAERVLPYWPIRALAECLLPVSDFDADLLFYQWKALNLFRGGLRVTDSEDLQSCFKAFAQPVLWKIFGNHSGTRGPQFEKVNRSNTFGGLTLDDLHKHILRIFSTLLPLLGEIWLVYLLQLVLLTKTGKVFFGKSSWSRSSGNREVINFRLLHPVLPPSWLLSQTAQDFEGCFGC